MKCLFNFRVTKFPSTLQPISWSLHVVVFCLHLVHLAIPDIEVKGTLPKDILSLAGEEDKDGAFMLWFVMVMKYFCY